MKKILGILGLFVFVFVVTAITEPKFVESAYNLENLVRWTALFGILSIGVAFVIITGGIDLSIGSVVGLVGCLLPWLLIEKGFSVAAALGAVLVVSLLIGLIHGWLITHLRLQPFVVTLCGLLFYRGYARYLTDDQTLGFGKAYAGLRTLATGRPCTLVFVAMVAGALLLGVNGLRLLVARRQKHGRPPHLVEWIAAAVLFLGAGSLWVFDVQTLDVWPFSDRYRIPIGQVDAPMPFLILLVLAVLAGLFLNRTIWGRYLYALGRNEEAARYSGIDTRKMVILAYVICALMAGIGGILFALDVNSIQPAMHGNFYELYAIAAAVLGGCSLRGGEGTILGVLVGAAVMRVLYNSINLLKIPTQLEFAIIGAVILLGVVSDELIRRLVARRRAGGVT